MKSNELDRIIREKLAGIEPAYNPETWKLLEQKLDGGAVTDPAEPAEETSLFDNLISSKVNNLSLPYQADSWSILENKLDGGPANAANEAPTTTEHFDNIVFEKLVDFQAPYSAKAWNAIVQTLQLKQKFYRLKLAEVGFLVLLLLFFYQALPVGLKESQPSPRAIPTPQGPVADRDSGRSGSLYNNDGNQEAETAIAAQERQSADESIDRKRTNSSGSEDRRTTSESGEGSISSSLAHLLDGGRAIDGSDQELLPPSPAARQQFDLTPLPLLNSFRLESEKNKLIAANDLHSDQVIEAYLEEGRPIEVFSVLPLHNIESVSPNEAPLKLKSIQSLKKKKTIRGSMFGSVDINQIITPPNFLERRFTEFNRYAVGYSTGFTLSFGKNRWEMETGMIYSAKYYSPPTVLFLVGGNIKDGYQAEGLKYFELDMFNIPLNFRYHYVNSGKWRAYGMVGASLQIAYQTHYYSETQEGLTGGTQGLSPAPSGITPGGPSNTLSSRKDIFAGWLEGGPFQDNSYLSLNLGAGVERYISSRFSAFVQPTYQYSFGLVPNILRNEIGPDKDKINTFSIFTGMRVRISN